MPKIYYIAKNIQPQPQYETDNALFCENKDECDAKFVMQIIANDCCLRDEST